MVDLVRANSSDGSIEARLIAEIERWGRVDEDQIFRAFSQSRATPDIISGFMKQPSEIVPVLPRDPGDERDRHYRQRSVIDSRRTTPRVSSSSTSERSASTIA